MDEHSNFGSKQIVAVSLLLCFTSFFIILFFLYPTYHSADDNYLLYEMSGALGNGPTNLLHYNYTWHPYLTYLLKRLFQTFPGQNWYSICLYSLHFISWFCLVTVILRRLSFKLALLLILLFFVVFEAQLLLRITYTNTSIILGIAALIYLGDKILLEKRLTLPNLLNPFLLLVIASMLRPHVLIPLIAVFLVLLPMFSIRRIVFIGLVFSLALCSFLVLNAAHEEYYKRNIPAWSSKEAYRQAVVNFDNHSKQLDTTRLTPKQILQKQWLENGILIDTSFLTTADIRNITNTRRKLARRLAVKTELYWLFTNNRLFILTSAGILFFSVVLSKRSNQKKAILILQALAVFAICTFLLLFMKLPYYLFPALLFFYSLCCMLPFMSNQEGLTFHVTRRYLMLAFCIGCISWGGVRLHKLSKENTEGQKAFTNAWQEISRNSDKLFIAPYFSIPLDDLGVFTSPLRHPMTNVVFKNSLMNHGHEKTYQRFGINSAKDLFISRNVRFLSPNTHLIQKYFELHYGQKLVSIRPAENYKHLMVTELHIETGVH